MIPREFDFIQLKRLIRQFPVTAILGSRQCGKTTLSKLFQGREYFDLENPRDIARLENPQLTLENIQGLIVIDEIQKKPDLFPLLRFLADTKPDQKYLILGSASRDLIRNSSESLAGRIGYYELGGFGLPDIGAENFRQLWLKGGYPRSYLADNDEDSNLWREQYIQTFLERDIPQLGISIPASTIRRFWTMLAHYNAQLLNYRELAVSFGVSDTTVRRYLEILEGTFMIRVLQPYYANLKKRLVKSPKIYLRDSGIFHTLQTIRNESELLSHPKLGASWEAFALEQVCRSINKRAEEVFFWRTHSGAELDLFWQEGGKNYGVEFKFQDAPGLTRSIASALEDLDLETIWIVYPGTKDYKIHPKVSVMSILNIGHQWDYSK